MKVSCHRGDLLAVFQLASLVVPTRDVKPVLRNVKVVATDGHCTLLATDLEVSTRLEIQGLSVEEPGSVLLPANRLNAILRESPDETLVVEAADQQSCLVRGDHSEFELCGEDPEAFPDVAAFEASAYYEVRAGDFQQLIRRTIFAAGVENSRYAITGVLCELEGKVARLVATDGRRLAVAECEATAQGEPSAKGTFHILPAKALQLLDRSLHDPEEMVSLALSPNDAIFRTNRATICTRLVEGRFPAYRDVIPKKSSVKVTLPVDAFQAAVRQAAVMADQESKRVVLGLAKNTLTLQANGPAIGRSRVEMPIEYAGKSLEVNFNPQYLTEMLRVLHATDTVELALNDANSPGLFRCGENYQYVVMPLT